MMVIATSHGSLYVMSLATIEKSVKHYEDNEDRVQGNYQGIVEGVD